MTTPPTTNDSTSPPVAKGIEIASTRRRPAVSASRPPSTKPIDAGVAVVSVKIAIAAAL